MPWYANQQIRQGGVLAYDVGHPVPATNVDRHGDDTAGLVDWVEPGEHYEAEPQPSQLMGVFVNAPVRPDEQPATEPTPQTEAPVEEGTRAPAKAAPKATTKTKPSDGTTTTPEG